MPISGDSRHLTDAVESELIMDQLDEVLIEFDRILKKYKIHKIKTIGDTYMAAGGIPGEKHYQSHRCGDGCPGDEPFPEPAAGGSMGSGTGT